MGEIFKLFGTIGVDNGEANSALSETEKKGESTTNKLVGFFKKAAVAIGTVFAAGKIIDFGKMSVEAAASAQALGAQFSQVFGDLEPKAQKVIDSMGDKMNILPNRIKPTFSKITSMFKGLGLDTETAMKKSEQATTLAADAAAFYDVSLEDASGSLTSFLKGNYEAGESIGVFANDTQLAQYAISQGVVGSTKDWTNLDEATKQATRLDYANNMLEQAGAVGQASREADGYENVMGNLNQAWQDFMAKMGAPILGLVVSVLQQVTSGISTLGDKVAGVIPNFDNFQNTFMSVVDNILNSGFFLNLEWSFRFVSEAIKNTVSIVSDQLPGIKSTFDDVFGTVQKVLTDVGGIIGGWATTVSMVFEQVIPIAIEIFKIAFEEIAGIVLPIVESLSGTFRSISSTITEAIINNVVPALEGFLTALQENKNLVDGLKAVVVGITTAFVTYKTITTAIKVAQQAYNVVLFASTLMTKGLDAATIAMAGAQGASTVAMKLNVAAVKAAAIAQKAFNAVMNANPIMIVVTLIMALVAAFLYLWNTNEDFRAKVIEIWNAVKEKAIEIFNGIAEFLSGVWDGIVESVTGFKDSVVEVWTAFKDKATEIFTAIGDFFSNLWEIIKNAAQTAWNVLFAVVGGIILSYINIWKGIFEGIRIYLGLLWDGIKAVAAAVWGAIGSTVMGFINTLVNGAINIFNFFKNGILTIFNGIKSVVLTVWNSIYNGVMFVVNAIVTFVTTIFQALSTTLGTIFNAIRSVASTVWNAISSTIKNVVTAIKNTVTNIFNALKNGITNIFNAIRNTASSVWNSIKSTVSNVVTSIKNTAVNIFNALKNTVTNIWNGIRDAVSNVVNSVKNTISNVWGGIKNTVSGIFDGVKNAIEGPMNRAKEIVKGVIDSIKGFFDFKFSWPNLPLPHFSISPKGWSIGDLVKGKIPSLGIEWHADGGIFNKPTLLGDGTHGVGEAGAEAVLPIDTLFGYIVDAMRQVIAEERGDGDIIVHQTINSPEALTPRETARQTKLALQDLAALRKK